MFQKIIQDKYLSRLVPAEIDERFAAFSAVFASPEKQRLIRESKEEQYQEGFLRDLFCSVLGYTINPEPDFNLITEKRNESAAETRSRDSRKADGAIILNGNVRAVIELKGCDTTDLAKIEPQAFGYKAHNPGCRYVIISNFEKLRFYIDDASDFLEFNLFTLSRDDFALLYLCLALPQIAADVPAKLKQESLSREISVTDKLYADYSAFKRALFADIVARNGEKFDKLLLFRKTQKLLDRLLFVLFCEDRGLLPANSLITEIHKWRQLKALDAYVPLYERIKKYFRYIDAGYANDDKTYVIYAYNGGLFKTDDVLDAIEISDEILLEHASRLAEYDFESEVSVDILGHIFEHSLSEIEEIQNEIAGNPVPAVGKRKKDGVFYTPAYITKYIVENTVGKLCDEKKNALGISDEIFAGTHRNKAQKAALDDKLKTYRAWLLSLKICDPACGSGAFLNAALQFLKREHALIDELAAKLYGDALVLQEVDNAILENNLYGVDINEESVEIAKLSLWLHTAQKGRKLSSLNNNLKCGNSLLNTAFDWEKEFPTVFPWRGDNPVSPSEISSSWRGDNPVALSKTPFPWKSDNPVSPLNPASFEGDKTVAPPQNSPQNSKFYNPTEEISKSSNTHLPHWHQDGKIQFVTFRLADSLPKEKLDELKARKEAFFNLHPEPWDADTALEYSDTVGKLADEWLDAGAGSCVLARPDVRKALEEVLFFNDGKQYRLHAFVIMPNHVHVLFELLGDTNLSKTLQLWKGISAKNINKILGNSDSLWQKESFDRLVRSERHYARIANYIAENPKNLPAASFSSWRGSWRGDNPVAPLNPVFPWKGDNPVSPLKTPSPWKSDNPVSPLNPASSEGDRIVAPPQNGFDVIIGNPPYVQLQTMGEMSNTYSKCGYESYNKNADLYCLFYEKGIRLLKPAGTLGFIASNKWLKANYGENLRKFLIENADPKILVDFPGVQIFPDATVDPQILIADKKTYSGKTIACVFKGKSTDIPRYVEQNKTEAAFTKDAWSIQSADDFATLEKMARGNAKLKNLPIEIFRGILTGYDDAFYIDEATKQKLVAEDPKSAELIKPLIRGRDVTAWTTKIENQYLINVHNGLKSRNSPPINIADYPAIKAHLDQFWGKLEKRYDKGDTPYNLRNCAYLEEFDKPKIIYPNMTAFFPFAYDEEKYFGNAKTYILTAKDEAFPLKALLAILNSKLAKLWIWHNCPELGDTRREIRKAYFENFPVPPIPPAEQAALVELADKMLSLNEKLQACSRAFFASLRDNLGVTKITGTLEAFHTLDFAGFLKELGKQKIKIALKDQNEWREFFAAESARSRELRAELAATDATINARVSALYGI